MPWKNPKTAVDVMIIISSFFVCCMHVDMRLHLNLLKSRHSVFITTLTIMQPLALPRPNSVSYSLQNHSVAVPLGMA